MIWLALGVLLLAFVVATRSVLWRRRDRALRASRELRLSRSLLDGDATALGSELAGLDLDAVTAAAGPEVAALVRDDHRRALASHASATRLLASATATDDLRVATEPLADAHLARATLLARLDGAPLPQPRPPCFFDPAHGPSTTDVGWPADDPAAARVPSCAADAQLLTDGRRPHARLVRLGDRSVRWFEAGTPYDAYAHAWFGSWPVAGAVQSVRTSVSMTVEAAGAWDQIGWAAGSNGGLGEAPPTVHHRLGQLASGQGPSGSEGSRGSGRRRGL